MMTEQQYQRRGEESDSFYYALESHIEAVYKPVGKFKGKELYKRHEEAYGTYYFTIGEGSTYDDGEWKIDENELEHEELIELISELLEEKAPAE